MTENLGQQTSRQQTSRRLASPFSTPDVGQDCPQGHPDCLTAPPPPPALITLMLCSRDSPKIFLPRSGLTLDGRLPNPSAFPFAEGHLKHSVNSKVTVLYQISVIPACQPASMSTTLHEPTRSGVPAQSDPQSREVTGPFTDEINARSSQKEERQFDMQLPSSHSVLPTTCHQQEGFLPSVPVNNYQKPGQHICPFCYRSFSRPSSCKIHTYSHTGKKPHKCGRDGCRKRFSVRSNMRRHEKICQAKSGTQDSRSSSRTTSLYSSSYTIRG